MIENTTVEAEVAAVQQAAEREVRQLRNRRRQEGFEEQEKIAAELEKLFKKSLDAMEKSEGEIISIGQRKKALESLPAQQEALTREQMMIAQNAGNALWQVVSSIEDRAESKAKPPTASREEEEQISVQAYEDVMGTNFAGRVKLWTESSGLRREHLRRLLRPRISRTYYGQTEDFKELERRTRTQKELDSDKVKAACLIVKAALPELKGLLQGKSANIKAPSFRPVWNEVMKQASKAAWDAMKPDAPRRVVSR